MPELLATAQHRHLAHPVVPVVEVRPVVPEMLLEAFSMKKSSDLSRQRIARDPLEDRDRGEVGAGQARAADDEGLFQHVLAAQAGVAGAVGEDDPGRAGGKLPAILAATLLECGVFLHGVMNLEHEGVIRRTVDHRQPQPRADLHDRPFPGVEQTRGSGQADLTREPARQSLEMVRGEPDSGPLGMNVHEDSQEPIAVRGPARERVEMKQIIA